LPLENAGDPFAAGLDTKTGKNKWYAVNDRGRPTVIELSDPPRILARNGLGDKFQATPALADGCLYLRSATALYCVGPGKRR
jgi:hypothetical protein